MRQKRWPTGIRTQNDRTKICSVTVTPLANRETRRKCMLFFLDMQAGYLILDYICRDWDCLAERKSLVLLSIAGIIIFIFM